MAMFKRADADGGPDPASPPKIGEARPIRSKNVSVIGPTLVFKGELSADEDLVIEGKSISQLASKVGSRQTSMPVPLSSKGDSSVIFTVKGSSRWQMVLTLWATFTVAVSSWKMAHDSKEESTWANERK
jgi:hypothetical protein